MSEHEKLLRACLQVVRGVIPKVGAEAVEALESLLAEQRASGLDDAMEVLSKRQAELDRQRVAAKSRSNSELADMKSEAATCSKAIHILRAERGRRKKGKEKTG